MSQNAPTAKGTLAATPFAHLLIYALDHRLTGTIVFEEASHAKHAIYFVDGAPGQARTASPIAPLGDLVREHRLVDPSALDGLLDEARTARRRLGETLVERQLLGVPALEALLREQVVRRLEFLATLGGETAYGYYEATNFLERAGGPSSQPGALGAIWRVIKAGVPPQRVRELLARLGDTPLRFHPDAPLARLELTPREQAVVDVLRAKPQPLPELVARGLVAGELTELLVYALSALRHFDIGTGTRPVGAERTSGSMRVAPAARPAVPPTGGENAAARAPLASSPPVRPSPSARPSPQAAPSPGAMSDALRRELRERLSSKKQSYYEVLGVPEDAPSPVIASAFFQLAKRFHPDRLGTEYDDVRDEATRLFARMTEAHQVLSDATRRKEYDELLEQGEGSAEEQEEVLRVVRAATAFQKAQVLLKRNNLQAAEAEARKALADDPEQADHVALVAWLDASKANADLESLLKVLNDCVKQEELNLRVRWYRGQLLKRLGHERRALEDFRFIADRDPRHVDAQRELRLHDLQRGGGKASGRKSLMPGASAGDRPRRPSTTPPGSDKGSFFGKLFKK
jgi:curved DNA-binding protein CbpA